MSLGLNNQLRAMSSPFDSLADAVQLLEIEIKALKAAEPKVSEEIIDNLTKVKKILEKLVEANEPGAFGGFMLSGGLIGLTSSSLNAKLIEAQEDVKRTKEELTRTKSDLNTTRDELERTKRALDRTDDALRETKLRLQKTEDDLRNSQIEAAENKRKFEKMQDEHNKLKDAHQELKKEIDSIKDNLDDANIKIADLLGKNTKDTEDQILGDFAYQIQNVLGMLFGPDVKMTGNQLIYNYKYTFDEKSKKKLELLGFGKKKEVAELGNAIESLKDNRFESAHHAIKNRIDYSTAKLRNLAMKHKVEGSIKPLIDLWTKAVKKGNIFDQDTWELDEKLF